MNANAIPAPVKAVVHASSRSYGRLTAPARLLPSFLICGGQRCGTTSLYRALAAHPTIRKAVLHKGVHYFDIAYDRGPRWYRGHFPLRRGGVRTFESSPYYMYHPLAAGRIARDLPGVKLIALVRDPVERAYSQHAHEVARGFETETDFATALAREPERLRGETERLRGEPFARSHSHQHHAYRARGEYVRYLRKLAAHVGRHRLHVVDSGRFFAEPERVYDEVLAFLGLPQAEYPAFEQHNARPRPAPMPAPVRAELTEHFDRYDAELETFLGTELSWRA
jgi:Sulfotransferase domain